ncbi:hypothetical protein G4Y79_09470 [Phototrophicus methaneseepsis]|uniref:Tetratricopeptide repeat protein n=1 Tax=Phototrophicus methaneseepsis TaxID=2710758 RepID=A0A7S8IFC2_9CHLR|nr:hypothetical protein [Phototrophicus methaneseepsis]QPC84585.1 hypothetical protein G4Y79_09470 [Phototrophicus methaneseepsis]
MRQRTHILIQGFILLILVTVCLSPAITQAQTEFNCEAPFIPDATPAYYLGQGAVYMEQGHYALAIQAYSCAIEQDAASAPAYARRGYAYAILLDEDAALSDFEQAIALDESFIETYLNRGSLYTRLGNYGLAMSDYTLVLALAPDNVMALNNRAIIHAIEGNYGFALTDTQAAIAADPEYLAAYATQAAIYSALANENYRAFVAHGGEDAPLPAGSPTTVLSAIDNNQSTGDPDIWLRLQDAVDR